MTFIYIRHIIKRGIIKRDAISDQDEWLAGRPDPNLTNGDIEKWKKSSERVKQLKPKSMEVD